MPHKNTKFSSHAMSVADVVGSGSGVAPAIWGDTAWTSVFPQWLLANTDGASAGLRQVVGAPLRGILGSGTALSSPDGSLATIATGPVWVATAAGGVTTVTSEAELNAAIASIDAGSGGSYTIDLGGTFALSSDLDALTQAGATVLLVGASNTIDGAKYHGFSVLAGALTLQDLTIENAVAQGGAGTGGGGGGLGAGGAVFVGSSGSVTLDGVTFLANAAIGGIGSSGSGGLGGGLNGGPGATGNGGFGQGGGGVATGPGGIGGFGGGGGEGSRNGTPFNNAGYGAGHGIVRGSYGAGGGGGLGAGGAVFVELGGQLTIGQGSMSGDMVSPGKGSAIGNGGRSFGSGLFVQSGSITLDPAAGSTLIISDQIQCSSLFGASGTNSIVIAGAGTVLLSASSDVEFGNVISGLILDAGAGLTVLSGINNVNDGITLDGGTLETSGPLNVSGGITLDGASQLVLGEDGSQSNFVSGRIQMNDGSTVTLQGATVSNGIEVDGGTLQVAGQSTIYSGINIGAAGGDVILQGTNFVSGITLTAGTVELGSPAAAGTTTITFAGSAADLQLDGTASESFAFTVNNFLAGDTIDLPGVSYAPGVSATPSGNSLTVMNGGTSISLTIGSLPNGSVPVVTAAPDGHGGTELLTDRSSFTSTVLTETDLNSRIAAIDQGPPAAYTIDLGSDIALSTDLLAFNLPSGSNLVINGMGHTIDGAGPATRLLRLCRVHRNREPDPCQHGGVRRRRRTGWRRRRRRSWRRLVRRRRRPGNIERRWFCRRYRVRWNWRRRRWPRRGCSELL